MPPETQSPVKSVLSVVAFSLAGETYALPISQVREIRRWEQPTPLPKALPFVEGVLLLRGRVVAVADLRKLLRLPLVEHGKMSRIVIIRLPRFSVGLIVDGVDKVMNIPTQTGPRLDPPVSSEDHSAIDGIMKLDKKVLILLRGTALFSDEEIERLLQVCSKTVS